jgi:drug/metabolite transporter (DMT)-like permease
MDTPLLLAALLSALLHALWNAAIKASAAPAETMAAQMTAAAIIGAAGLLVTGLPPPAAWPWIACSTAMNTVAVGATLRAYREGGFGTVYPIARATSVLVVAGSSAWLVGERLGPWAALGVGCVATALLLLARDTARAPSAGAAARASTTLPPAALAWTLAAGVATAGYVLSDAQAVRAAGSPWAYAFAVSVTNALAMGWRQRALGSPWTLLARHARTGVPAGIVATVSYALILWVFTRAPIAPAAALRDTSAVFAMLIAVAWLKEPMPARRLAVVALALAGVPLLRLG